MSEPPAPVQEQTGSNQAVRARWRSLSGRELTIGISFRTILLILGIIVLIWVIVRLASLILALFAASLLATALDQPTSWLQRRGVPRGVGVLLCYLLIGALLAGLVVMLVPLINSEITTLQDQLPSYARQVDDFLQRVAPGSVSGSHITVTDLFARLGNHLDTVATTLTRISVTAGRDVVLLFVILVASYYLAVAQNPGIQLITRFVPAEHQQRGVGIAGEIRHRIGGWVRGQVLVAVVFGLGMGLGLWLLGIPYAATLGTVAAVLEWIPYLGGITTLALAVPLALTVSLTRAIGVVILYVVLANIEAHVLAPYFLGRAIKLPPLAVLVALFAGAELFGIFGIFLAVPLLVVIWAFIDELWPSEAQAAIDEAVRPEATDRARPV